MNDAINHSKIRDVRPLSSSSRGTSIELITFNGDADKVGVKTLLLEDDEDIMSTSYESNGSAPHEAQAASNIFISFIGSGILGVPNAFRKSGWLLGPVSLAVISALNAYAMLLLPQVKKALVKSKHLKSSCSYGDIGLCIMGTFGEYVVNLCLGISQAGFATASIIFISKSLFRIAHIPRAVTCMACIPGLALLVQFRDMEYLSPFSLLANTAVIVALSAILYYDFEAFQGYDPSEHSEPLHAVTWDGFIYVTAISIYCMEGVGLVLPLEASCKHQPSFPWLLRGMLVFITAFMVIFGLGGYLAFGDQTVAPITLNLVDHFWSARFVKCGLCFGLYFSFPVMMFPVWTIAESLSAKVKNDRTTRIVFRSLLVVASALIAYAVPDFGKFLSLVGSSMCTILGFILPCYFHLVVMKESLALWQIALNWSLIVGGAIFGVLGTYNSFVALVYAG